MNLIIIFWLNADNWAAVIPNNPERGTIDEQVKKWEIEHREVSGHYGFQYYMEM